MPATRSQKLLHRLKKKKKIDVQAEVLTGMQFDIKVHSLPANTRFFHVITCQSRTLKICSGSIFFSATYYLYDPAIYKIHISKKLWIAFYKILNSRSLLFYCAATFFKTWLKILVLKVSLILSSSAHSNSASCMCSKLAECIFTVFLIKNIGRRKRH